MPMRLDEEPPPGPSASVDHEKKRIFGLAVQNDRGPMAAFMIAARAIKNSGLRLSGDIIMTMVVGEIGMGPVDEFRGARFIGKGYGSRHAVTHGINGDFALIAETTDFGVTWIEAGAAYFKITLEGRSFYTPRLQSGHGERQPERADKNDPGDRSYRKMGGGIREQIHHGVSCGKNGSESQHRRDSRRGTV